MIKTNKCQQCHYEWKSKDPERKPVQCPRCKRYDWSALMEIKQDRQKDNEDGDVAPMIQ